MRVGLDFDNTIVCYDELFAALAVEEGFFDAAPKGGKKAVRDKLRTRPGGEMAWRKLQALAYGPRIAEAKPYEGVMEFLSRGFSAGFRFVVVSHKTRRPASADVDADLREAALAWMEGQGFFGRRGFGLSPDDVHFEDSRAEKVTRIAELNCGIFVDDLEEVFAEPGFPGHTRGILFAPGHLETRLPITVCRNWSEISNELLGQSAVA